MDERMIVQIAGECTQSFNRLINLVEGLEELPQHLSRSKGQLTMVQSARDEYGRLRVWIESVGADRSDRLSLDFRLQDSTRVKKAVTGLLEDLRVALDDGKHCEFPCNCFVPSALADS